MMKKIILLGFLILTACSSSTVKPDSSEDEPASASIATQAAAAPPSGSTTDKNLPEIRRDEKVSASQYAPLNDAIKQQNDDAIQKVAGEILTQNSKDLVALNALAMIYYKKSRFDAAAYLLKKAIAAHPESSEAYGNMGLVLLAQNERREAIKSFRRAIEINANNGVAGANLGSIYVQEKDYNKALMALDVAVKNGQRDFKVMNNYAVALSASGKTKEAADIYEKILKENPSQKDVMLNYSILLIEDLNKNKEGLDLLNRLKFVGSSPETREIIKQLENKAKAGLQ